MSTRATKKVSSAQPAKGCYPLSLHQLTALDASVPDLIAIATELGCAAICLFTYLPERLKPLFPCIETAAEAKAVMARLADSPLTVCNLEMFPVEETIDLEACRRGLERGAMLGARRATTQIHVRDEAAASQAFGRLCSAAAEFEIEIGVEFTGFAAIDSLAAAQSFVTRCGAPNASIVLDALHLVRTGGKTQQIRAATRIGYAQLCDGPLATPPGGYRQEAIADRVLPGAGEFPLVEILAALPGGTPLSVEVPQHPLRDAGVGPAERARRAVDAARTVLDRVALRL